MWVLELRKINDYITILIFLVTFLNECMPASSYNCSSINMPSTIASLWFSSGMTSNFATTFHHIYILSYILTFDIHHVNCTYRTYNDAQFRKRSIIMCIQSQNLCQYKIEVSSIIKLKILTRFSDSVDHILEDISLVKIFRFCWSEYFGLDIQILRYL